MGSKFEQKAKYFSSDVLSTVSIVVAKALYCIMPGILLIISTGTTKAFVK